MVFNDCPRKFLGVVSDSAEGEGGTILDGDSWIKEQRTELLEDPERVQVIDILRFRGEVS
jgi:hypothetical protein